MAETIDAKQVFDQIRGESPEIPVENLETKKGRRESERITHCSECGSKSVIRDYVKGEVVCNDCGLVVDESLIDTGPEWSAYDAEQRLRRSRVGSPASIMIHDGGLGSVFNPGGKDARKQDFKDRGRLYRMQRQHNRARVGSAADRNVSFAMGELHRMSSALGLKQGTRERAAYIYREVVEGGFGRGRSIEAVLGATIFGVCKEDGTPRTFKEIADVARVSRREIMTNYRELSKNKRLKIKRKLTSPLEYVSRFISELKLPYEYVGYVSRILEEADERHILGGRVPAVKAAGAIYLAWLLYSVNQNTGVLTQSMVKGATGVSEVSIRNAYKEMAEGLGLSETVGDKSEESQLEQQLRI